MEIQSHRRMNLKEESRARESNSLKGGKKSKQPATKRKRADSTSSSDLAAISDGEVIDDDALSIDCHDDELLREKENELDDKEHTADKVALSAADLINKRFSVASLVYFFNYYLSILLHPTKTFCRLCFVGPCVSCRIGEYISPHLFYFVNLTSSCSLIPQI